MCSRSPDFSSGRRRNNPGKRVGGSEPAEQLLYQVWVAQHTLITNPLTPHQADTYAQGLGGSLGNGHSLFQSLRNQDQQSFRGPTWACVHQWCGRRAGVDLRRAAGWGTGLTAHTEFRAGWRLSRSEINFYRCSTRASWRAPSSMLGREMDSPTSVAEWWKLSRLLAIMDNPSHNTIKVVLLHAIELFNTAMRK